MSRPRKSAWLKPSNAPYKLLMAIASSDKPVSVKEFYKIASKNYTTKSAIISSIGELLRAGLLQRVMCLTEAGIKSLEISKPPEPKPPKIKAAPKPRAQRAPRVQKEKPAPTTAQGIGSTGFMHPWR